MESSQLFKAVGVFLIAAAVCLPAMAQTNSVHVANSHLGVGTDNPQNAIHMVRPGTAALLMDDTTAPANRSVAQMYVQNTGAFHIRGLTDALGVSAEGIHIDFGNANIGLGCRNSAFDLTVGDGGACGSSDSGINAGQTQFTVTSARSAKKNLAPVQVDGLLDKMAEIDVYTYDYIDGPADRIGLMAEDFHRVFGRGSEQTITGDDVQMALWLAVQELAAQNKALTEQVESLLAAQRDGSR